MSRSYECSIIIPVLNEADGINACVGRLLSLKSDEPCEIIVVDGDHQGETIHAIHHENIITLSSAPGRARQMNAGAACAKGEILIFLHADTELPPHAIDQISSIIRRGPYVGGAFDLGIKSDRFIFKLIAGIASWRSRFTRIPYGDQVIFIKRDYFFKIGGYKDMLLMEDVEIMQRIKREGEKIFIISDRVYTSPRRWEKEGIVYCTLRNWVVSSLYYLGISANKLSRFYPKRGHYAGLPWSLKTRSDDRCILLFAKYPERGKVKSRLAAELKGFDTIALYQKFVFDVLVMIESLDIPFQIYYSPGDAKKKFREWLGERYLFVPQQGNDLGERMINGFLQTFSQGFRQVIIVGGDSPDLPNTLIEEAFVSLKTKDSVIGPARDGGYYLIGFTRDSFLSEAFEHIPWSSSAVFQVTYSTMKKAGQNIHILPEWSDVDTLHDLRDLVQRGKASAFIVSRTMTFLLKNDLSWWEKQDKHAP